MPSKLNPYINFNGNAKEAMEFYESAFGGKLVMTTFKEGGMSPSDEEGDQIMHAMLIAENGITLMGADTPKSMQYKPGTNVSISLGGDNEGELKGYFDKLSQGGKILQPLAKAPWGDQFGMFTDKFGIKWLVNITQKK